MTPAAPVLVQLDQRRLAARAEAEEPAARAEGRFLELALELQCLSCACIADTIILRFAEHLTALRRNEPTLSSTFQGTVIEALETLKRDARKSAANGGMTPEEGERLALAGAAGFTGRMALLFPNASEGGHA